MPASAERAKGLKDEDGITRPVRVAEGEEEEEEEVVVAAAEPRPTRIL